MTVIEMSPSKQTVAGRYATLARVGGPHTGVLVMLRIAILALSATFAVAPALAKTTSPSAASVSPTRQGTAGQSLLLDDGTSAMAQGSNNQRDDMWIGIGMFAVSAAILIPLGIQAQNKGHAVSP